MERGRKRFSLYFIFFTLEVLLSIFLGMENASMDIPPDTVMIRSDSMMIATDVV